MPETKVSALPAATAPDGTEVVLGVQGGVSKKIPVGAANGLATLGVDGKHLPSQSATGAIAAPNPTGVAATDTANLNAVWAAGTAQVILQPGVYVVNALTGPANNYARTVGAGKGLTVIRAAGAVDMLTLVPGALYQTFERFTLDGNGVANRGVYLPDNAGIGSTWIDGETYGCKGAPGIGIENANRAYSMEFRRWKWTNNKQHGKLIKFVQNTHFYGCDSDGATVRGWELGDGLTNPGLIAFHGGSIEHLAGVQDNILCKLVQPLIIDGLYMESPVAGSTCVRVSGAGKSTVVVSGFYAAGGGVCVNPIVIDAAAGGSSVSLDGWQVNGYTGLTVQDNSAGSFVMRSPGIENGALAALRIPPNSDTLGAFKANRLVAGTAVLTDAIAGLRLHGTDSNALTKMVLKNVGAPGREYQWSVTDAGTLSLYDITGGGTVLSISAFNVQATLGKVLAGAGLGVGNSVAAATPGAVVRKMEVFDAAGASLGFVPIYNAIT